MSSYRGKRPTHPQTNRQDRLQYTAPQLAHSVSMQASGLQSERLKGCLGGGLRSPSASILVFFCVEILYENDGSSTIRSIELACVINNILIYPTSRASRLNIQAPNFTLK